MQSEWLEAMFDYLKTEREDFHGSVCVGMGWLTLCAESTAISGDAQKRVEKFWSNLAARQPRVSSLVRRC